MGLLGDLVKSTVDAGLGMITSAWQNKLNKNASEQAFKNQLFGSKELARYQAYDLPSVAMAGYKKAGINPIIAYGGLNTSVPSMSVSAAHQTAPDFGAVFSRATARKELELRESIAEQEQKRADRLTDAKIADMIEARRLQERSINNSGVTGILKYVFGEDSQGKAGPMLQRLLSPLVDKIVTSHAEATSADKERRQVELLTKQKLDKELSWLRATMPEVVKPVPSFTRSGERHSAITRSAGPFTRSGERHSRIKRPSDTQKRMDIELYKNRGYLK